MNTFETNLLYFFSTSAQCSAAFAALVGLFAVFRLQTNATRLDEFYDAARWWLANEPCLGNASSLPREGVKEWLGKIKKGEWQAEHGKSAGQVMQRLLDAEGMNRDIAFAVVWPLKLWTLIFIFSLALIPHVKWYIGFSTTILITLFLVFIIGAIWKTSKFIQVCLTF